MPNPENVVPYGKHNHLMAQYGGPESYDQMVYNLVSKMAIMKDTQRDTTMAMITAAPSVFLTVLMPVINKVLPKAASSSQSHH